MSTGPTTTRQVQAAYLRLVLAKGVLGSKYQRVFAVLRGARLEIHDANNVTMHDMDTFEASGQPLHHCDLRNYHTEALPSSGTGFVVGRKVQFSLHFKDIKQLERTLPPRSPSRRIPWNSGIFG